MSTLFKKTLIAISFVFLSIFHVYASGGSLTSGNVLVIQDNDIMDEYQLDGTKIQSFDFSRSGAGSAEYLRDVIVGSNGDVYAFNGTFDPVMSTLTPSTGNFATDLSFSEWSTVNNGTYGGIAVFNDWVFVSDGATNGGEAKGIVRFDLSGGNHQRFSNTEEFIQLTIGNDALLYGLSSLKEILVFNPITLDLLNTINLSGDLFTAGLRAIAVDSNSTIYGVAWNDGKIYAFNTSGTILNSIASGTSTLGDININEDGNLLVIGGWDGEVYWTDAALSTPTLLSFTAAESNAAFTTGMTFVSLTMTQPTNGTVTSTIDLNCGTDGTKCSDPYLSGATVSLTATPDTNYTFDGWGGDCSSASFTISTDMTCSATFSAEDDNSDDSSDSDTDDSDNSNSSDSDTDNANNSDTDDSDNSNSSDSDTDNSDNSSSSNAPPPSQPNYYLLSVGGSKAHITSQPGGIDCEYGEGICSQVFDRGEVVELELVKIKTADGFSQDNYDIQWFGDADCQDQVVTMHDTKQCAVRVYGKQGVDYSAGSNDSDNTSDTTTGQLELLNFSGHSLLRGGSEDLILGFILEGEGTTDVTLHADVIDVGVIPKFDLNQVFYDDVVGFYADLLDQQQQSDSFTFDKTIKAGIYTIQLSSNGMKGRGMAGISLKNNQLNLTNLSVRGYLQDALVLNFIVGGEGTQQIQVNSRILSGDVETQLQMLNLATLQIVGNGVLTEGSTLEVGTGAYAVLLNVLSGQGVGMIEVDLIQ